MNTTSQRHRFHSHRCTTAPHAAQRVTRQRTLLACALLTALCVPLGYTQPLTATPPATCNGTGEMPSDRARCLQQAPVGGVAAARALPERFIAINTGPDADDAPASAPAPSAMAIGANALANGPAGVAIGGNTQAVGNGVAVGTRSRAIGFWSTAVGTGAYASGEKSMALGMSAEATANGAVAIGHLSVADQPDTVSLGNTSLQRRLVNVAAGEVSATSSEAIAGAQLHATNERVSTAERSIGTLQGELGRVDGTLMQLDRRTTDTEGGLGMLAQQVNDLSSGAAGLVARDARTGAVTVATQLGGTVVDLTGTDGDRRLRGVASGTADNDAVTLAQLKASGLVDPNNGRALAALVYDDMSLDRATLGGSDGTVLANLGSGRIAAGSREAINGGQLWQLQADWDARWGRMGDRVDSIERALSDGGIGGPGPGPGPGPGEGGGGPVTAPGSGDGSVQLGGGADASGQGSVALGQGASASGHNAVAVGGGATTDRDNEFSVGHAGGERVIGNVAAGVRPTDAVNLQQLDDRFAAERDRVEGRFLGLDKRLDRIGAMNAAMVNMAVSASGVNTSNRLGAGIGVQNGRAALAVGYQRALGERATISMGASFSGDERAAGLGAGFGW